jgi:hypothetical protein
MTTKRERSKISRSFDDLRSEIKKNWRYFKGTNTKHDVCEEQPKTARNLSFGAVG